MPGDGRLHLLHPRDSRRNGTRGEDRSLGTVYLPDPRSDITEIRNQKSSKTPKHGFTVKNRRKATTQLN